MATTTCPACTSNRVSLVISSPTGNRYRCDTCRHGWRTGGRRVGVGARAKAPSTFPADHTLDDAAGAERFKALLDRYTIVGGKPDEAEIAWRAEAAKLFAPGNIDSAPASIFHDLSDRTTVATTGRQVAYRKNWTTMGEDEATAVARRTTAHLLHGDGDITSRIDDVLAGKGDIGMPGFKEAIVTKILAIAEPDTFIPILTTVGKVAFLQHIWGVRVDVPKGQMGQNIVWSNGLVTDRLRGSFPDLLHAAHFLWWTRTEL